jgi:AcrR family transcriptional regulator
MDSVAAAADVAKGTIYRYFRSRAELFAALREEYAESLAALARAALLESTAPPAARWARFAESMLDYSLSNQPLHHALFQDEAVSEDHSMEPLREVVGEFLEQQVRDGRLGIQRPEFLLRVLLDGFHGALVVVAHGETAARDASPREDFLAVARLLGEALLGSHQETTPNRR